MSEAGEALWGMLVALCCWAGGGDATVQVGGVATQAIKIEDTIACWGLNSYGQATPSGSFRSVAPEACTTAGSGVTDTVACWGKNADGEATLLTT